MVIPILDYPKNKCIIGYKAIFLAQLKITLRATKSLLFLFSMFVAHDVLCCRVTSNLKVPCWQSAGKSSSQN
jgi:hypothetical protein